MPQEQLPSILHSPESLRTLTLKDGRKVSLSLCGDPTGRPVFFLHPIQGNRFMPLTMHKAASSLQLNIIAPDRPGIGSSSPLPCRTVQQYPADIAEICQQLGIKQFSVMASSAGTLYALALTLAPETRDMIVGKVTLVAPWLPPSSRPPGFGGLLALLGGWTPLPLLQAFVGFTNSRVVAQSHTRPVTDLMTRSNAQEVAAFAADPGNDAIYKAMINEWTGSLAGIMQEMQLCMERSNPLHLNYCQDITAPIRVFMGTADAVMVYSHVQHWAQHAAAGNVELITVEGGTHDGLMHTHKTAAIEALAADLQQHR
uniref:AB hydrolase-1 domain-containing protein n=1 Tax=Tetradesmus obliquus TaxID=3088 RepID=A0A383V9Q8_TETOB|eukprot:jgi/Sobl393_1/3599/SZX61911.1